MKKLSIIFYICTLLLCSLLAGCGKQEAGPEQQVRQQGACTCCGPQAAGCSNL